MTVIKRISYWGSILIIMAIITTCTTYQPTAKTESNTAKIDYPSLNVPLPETDLFVELPKPKQELYKTDKKPVTTNFTSFETKNVRTKDPLLFSSGNTIIIDFKYLDDCAYAFPLPGSKVISPYGGRRRHHSGVDLKTCANDTILSAFDGIVRMSAPYAAYGNVIVVRHYNGLETVYSHNSRNLVKPGDIVKAGQPIGLTGRTGRATTEHLHFEVRINGEHINPILFFDFEKRELRKQCFTCTKKGQKITVAPVDHFPFQKQYLSAY